MTENPFYSFESADEISRRIDEIDRLISEQLNEILHHPEFKALESTWRGLFYLVNQVEYSLQVKVKIFQARKVDLLKDFDRADEIEKSALYKHIFTNVYRFAAADAFGLLIGAYEFDHLPGDVSILEKMSAIAAQAHAPFIAAASPSMFYLENFEEISDFRDLSKNFELPQYNRWKKFRETSQSNYVALCLPHILLRAPQKTAKSFNFRESTEKQDLLWGNAAFAFAGCAARAFYEKSWLGEMRGLGSEGEIFGLDSVSFLGKQSSLDADLENYFRDLLTQGFMVLIDDSGGKPYFWGSQSTHRPPDSVSVNEHVARLWSQIETVLACSRFAVNLMSLRIDNFHRLKGENEIRNTMISWLGRYRHESDDVSIQEKARKPLREFLFNLEEIPDMPVEFKGVLFVRPTYLLEDIKIAARLEIYFPSPDNPDY